jgi:enamidase
MTLTHLAALALLAQQPTPQFVSVPDSVVALTNVTVIDGTGAAPKRAQTIVMKGGVIQAVGATGQVTVPADARTMDLAGRSVMPGYVMLHEHLFYRSGGGAVYNEQGYSFPRLYLAGGVTTMRTAGNMAGYADLNIKKNIDAGTMIGPTIDVTAPYLEGSPGIPVPQVKQMRDANDARSMVNYWANEGATSFKAYMNITRAELGAAAEEAHKRGLKITGHLCSVTFREAAALGIDDLEHGFIVASDFVPNKQPDRCPAGNAVQQSIATLDVNSAAVRDLIAELVRRKVAITSTLTIFETFAPLQPSAPQKALDAMLPEVRRQYEQRRAAITSSTDSTWTAILRNEMRLEKMFADAGGLLVVGTDPTGYGGVVAGFSNQRALELLVQSGFSPVEAIKIATLNGARYLGRDAKIGTIAAGKQADLVVVRGDPSAKIEDVENVEIVFKRGVGYDSARIFESVKGRVGLH